MTDTTVGGLLTTREVAQLARLSVRTVALAAKNGDLRSIQGGQGRGYRYRSDWVAEWLGLTPEELSALPQAVAS